MFSKTAEYYDRIYKQLKDYEEEADKIRAIIEKENPEAETILDVACGTAKHAEILHKKFDYQITGIDLNEDFVRIAKENFPQGNFSQADMRDFSLDKRFDVVMCLFSSIGYVKERESVVQTLKCFREHLKENGIVIVEAWFTPEDFIDGHVFFSTVDDEDLKIVRMGYSEKIDYISKITFEYLIGDKDGIRHETEIHEAGLFSVEEMKGFFEKSGFETKYDPVGLINRGLYIAKAV